ncbi:MAG: hypothetical protein QOD63_1120 [Actinomycetota bacterium]|jgi:hypothetical protein|nr:hypothetical protein [Actinomycetota bacterium]
MMVEMARFLSPEWLDLLAAAASAAAGDPDGTGTPFAIRQVVTGGPDGDVEYVVRADAGRFSVHRAGEIRADVDIIQDYDTATAISQGRLSPAVAFAGGRLKMGGGVGQLVEHQEEFAALGELFASVRSATTY